MVAVTYKKYGVRLTHIWFAKSRNEIADSVRGGVRLGDVLFVHGADFSPDNGILLNNQYSLKKDLYIPDDELFLTLGKHLKQYIKRNQKDEEIHIRFFDSYETACREDIIGKCKFLYEKMFSDKGMKSKFNSKLVNEYFNNKALVIGAAYKNNEMIGFSAAIHDDQNARLWLAAFDFRNNEADSQLFSRSHQRLDWELLLWCKYHGIRCFDFGGVNSFDKPNGIAEFKMGFEKENKVTYSNYLVPNTILGKIAVKAYINR